MDNNINIDYSKWERGKDYPEFFDEISLATISKGYLQPNETPRTAYKRVAHAIAHRLRRPDLERKFFNYMWKGWLCLASPVLANTGCDKGLPISCFGIDTPDSIRGIGLTNAELMRLSASGGGVGISVSRIRGRGAKIANGSGVSEGVVPWCKIYDSTIIATNQGQVRRGASSVNLRINHPDIKEFLQIRRPKGDPNRQCLNLHQCVVIDDAFMKRIENGDIEARNLWLDILKTRMETGEPYIMFEDNVNKHNPVSYTKNNLSVSMTNICLTGDTMITIRYENEIIDCRLDELDFFISHFNLVEIESYNEDTREIEFKPILDFGMTNEDAEIFEITDEDTGVTIQCTAEHKIFTTNRGYVKAIDLNENDKLLIK